MENLHLAEEVFEADTALDQREETSDQGDNDELRRTTIDSREDRSEQLLHQCRAKIMSLSLTLWANWLL